MNSTPHTPAKIDIGFAIVLALAVVAGIGVWVVQGPAAFFDILRADMGFALILLPKIAGGIIFAITLGIVLPKDRVLRAVGPDSGWRGLTIATLAGAVIPGGPSVMFPLATGLLASGADLGAAVAMISGWVLLSVNRTLVWELSFIPVDLVGLRLLLTLPVPLLLGYAARAAVGRRRAAS